MFEGKSLSYVTGFICGFLSIFVVVFVLRIIAKKVFKNSKKQNYDERQIAARGQAAATGFTTLCIWQVFSMLFESTLGINFIDPALWHLLGLLVGMTAFAMACIWRDAYFTVNNKKLPFFIIIGIGIVANLAIFFANGGFNAGISDNGLYGSHYVNFFVVIMLVVISINIVIKHFVDLKAAEE